MTIKNAFDENRIFGVEIEFLATIDRNELQNKCRELGVNCYVESYNHIDNDDYWKIVTDSSCGYEIVSPRLKGHDGLAQIEKVCNALNQLGAKVNKNCGLHVHHDARDFTVNTFKNILNIYVRYEKVFDTMMPQSRRANNNTFCRTMIKDDVQETLNKIKNCKTVYDLTCGLYYSRYGKVNLQSYTLHGSIEFRQHSGTTDAEKIINWVVLTQAIVNISKRQVRVWTVKENKINMTELFWSLAIMNSCTNDDTMIKARNYAKNRIKNFEREVA